MAARPLAGLAAGYASGESRGIRPVPSGYAGELCPATPEPARQSWISSLGVDAAVLVDEAMENSDDTGFRIGPAGAGKHFYIYLTVLLLAAAIYVGCILSPPSLMDDVDAVQAQIARNMVTSGDWVTARLDGIIYLEKSPLIYWLIAISYKIFGFFDWAARIPMALSSMGLAAVTAAFGVWA